MTKALRDIGPFAFLEDGEPFAGCLFHEMVVADGRKMSKHLGNVVDPDELVEPPRRRHGAARDPLRGRPGEDAELERRRDALRQPLPQQPLGLRARPLRRRSRRRRVDEEAETDTGFMRERLVKWCDNGVERITDDLAELQMHKAVRNVTRLFERIQDFEKRVVKRRGRLSRADAEALAEALVAARRGCWRPFAPHFAEGLLLAGWREDDVESLATWPQPVESLS